MTLGNLAGNAVLGFALACLFIGIALAAVGIVTLGVGFVGAFL